MMEISNKRRKCYFDKLQNESLKKKIFKDGKINNTMRTMRYIIV